jgi:acetyl esterase/lipase
MRTYSEMLVRGIGLASFTVLAACATNPANGREPMAWSAGQFYSALTSEHGIEAETGVAYGTHPRQKLDIYRADPATEKAPIIVFYYGGGWSDGDRATYKFVGTALAKRGITTIIPDYRLFPEVKFPTFVDDAAKAYAWVSANLSNAGKRPIIVAGHSAGGHTAALLALDPTYLGRHAPGAVRPAGLIGMAGPYSFDATTWPTTRQIFAPAVGQPDRARPVSFVKSGAPPTLLMHGSADVTVKLFNTKDLAGALGKVQTPVQVIEYPGVGHVGLVIAMSKPFRWRAPVLDDVVNFVDLLVAKQNMRTPERSNAKPVQ